MASIHPDAIAKARELGSTGHSEGINWCWANSFPTKESADQFNAWCVNQGYETRGVYGSDNDYAVRFRKDSDIVW